MDHSPTPIKKKIEKPPKRLPKENKNNPLLTSIVITTTIAIEHKFKDLPNDENKEQLDFYSEEETNKRKPKPKTPTFTIYKAKYMCNLMKEMEDRAGPDFSIKTIENK